MSIIINDNAEQIVSIENGAITWNAHRFYMDHFKITDYRNAAFISGEIYNAVIIYKDSIYHLYAYKKDNKASLPFEIHIHVVNNFITIEYISEGYLIDFTRFSSYNRLTDEEIIARTGPGKQFLCTLITYIIKKERTPLETTISINLKMYESEIAEYFYERNGFKIISNPRIFIATVSSYMKHCNDSLAVLDMMDYIKINASDVYKMLYFYCLKHCDSIEYMSKLFGYMKTISLPAFSDKSKKEYIPPVGEIKVIGLELGEVDDIVHISYPFYIFISNTDNDIVYIQGSEITFNLKKFINELAEPLIKFNDSIYEHTDTVVYNEDANFLVNIGLYNNIVTMIVYPTIFKKIIPVKVSDETCYYPFIILARLEDKNKAVIYQISTLLTHPYTDRDNRHINLDRIKYIKILIKHMNTYYGVKQVKFTLRDEFYRCNNGKGYTNSIFDFLKFDEDKIKQEGNTLTYEASLAELNFNAAQAMLRINEYLKRNKIDIWKMLYYYKNGCRQQANEISTKYFGIDLITGRSLKRIDIVEEPYTGSLLYTLL